MNKTVTINISGIIFHIEEDAYLNLSGYLAALKARFATQPDGAEILADIESRIAELMQTKINASKQVLVNADVDDVKSIMGRPEDLGGEEPGEAKEHLRDQPHEHIKRRFFRDPDDKVFGGVCSGLAAYFDIDRVWVRLAMFVLIFFGGLSLWVYVILWIVIPEARTTAEKLAMRGQPANISNIMRNVREEADEVKHRLARYGNELNRQYGDRVRDNVTGVLGTVFRIIGRIAGLFLMIMGVCLLIGYVAVITGVSVVNLNTNVANWKMAVFASGIDYPLAILAFVIVAGVPIFLLLYTGIKLLFRIRYSNRWLALGLGMTWVLGIILAFYVAINTAQQFAESNRIRDEIALDDAGDTLVVKMHATPEYYPHDDDEDDLSLGRVRVTGGGSRVSIVGTPGIDVRESRNGKASMMITYSARGADKHEAFSNAKAIRYNYVREGNTLVFDENFIVTDDVKFRNPAVEVILYLPPGKVVLLDNSIKDLLDDVENTTHTSDSDMAGRRWKMTDRGLECIDCADLPSDDIVIDRKGHHRHVHVGKHGIHVKSDKEEVHIDENGVEVRDNEEHKQ